MFSGQGVVNLRKHFNRMLAAEEQARRSMQAALPVDTPIFPATAPAQVPTQLQNLESGFEDGDPDAIEDDDVPEDGSEMVIDTQPLLNHNNIGLGVDPAAVGAIPAPPPIPVPPQVSSTNPLAYAAGHPPYIPVPIPFHGIPETADEPMLQHHGEPTGHAGGFGNGDANQGAATVGNNANGHHHVTPVHAMIDISIPADELEQISQSGGPVQGHHTPPTEGPGGT